MKPKPTPGPWVVYPETDGTEICAVDMKPGLPVRQIICRIVRGDNWIRNNFLIAAAPDLLEALKEALKDSGCDGDLCCHWWHEAARAAIAKAEGGAE